jgi:hypothetical protein
MQNAFNKFSTQNVAKSFKNSSAKHSVSNSKALSYNTT